MGIEKLHCHSLLESALVDLVKLEMVDFDTDLGLYCLHSYYASVYCITRIVQFQFPKDLVLEWRASILIHMGRFYLLHNSHSRES